MILLLHAGLTASFAGQLLPSSRSAVDLTAWSLDQRVGRVEKRFSRTIAYISPQDLRYFQLVLAGPETGHQIYVSSPRHTA